MSSLEVLNIAKAATIFVI